MTIPEVFATTWERTDGDVKKCFRAVRAELSRNGVPRPQSLTSAQDMTDMEWANAQRIAKVVAEDNDLKLSDLRGPSRLQVIVVPRNVAMVMIRHVMRLSYRAIGAVFQGRDHSTVMHACESAEVWLAQRPGVFERLRKLCEAAVAPPAPASEAA